MTLEFPCQLAAGRLPPPVADQLALSLRVLWDKPVVVTVKEVKRKRSLNQNAYYWSCVIPPLLALFRDAGNDADDEDVHDHLVEHVGKLKRVMVDPDGLVFLRRGSTRRLTTREFSDYLDKCMAFAASHGIDIPPPDPLHGSTTDKEHAP